MVADQDEASGRLWVVPGLPQERQSGGGHLELGHRQLAAISCEAEKCVHICLANGARFLPFISAHL